MMWWLPWLAGTVAWPALFALTSNPLLATGLSLVVYGGVMALLS